MSHQSKAPPPPPLLDGAFTVREADALIELPPAGAVVSELAAMVLVKAPAVALFTLTVMEQLPFTGIRAPTIVTVLAEVVKVPDVPMQVVVGAGDD